MGIKKIIWWNIAFAILYILLSSIIYLISKQKETVTGIIVIGLIFNLILTIFLLKKRKSEHPMDDLLKFMFEKNHGGEKKHEQRNIKENIAPTGLSDDDSNTSNVH